MDLEKLQKARAKAFDLHNEWRQRTGKDETKINSSLINRAIRFAHILTNKEQQAFAIIERDLKEHGRKLHTAKAGRG